MDMKRWLTTQADRVAAIVALIAGTLALYGGYRGISDAIYPGQQLPYIISGGLVGLFLVGLAAALWLSADLRDEWRKLDELNTNVIELLDIARRTGEAPEVRQPAAAATTAVEAGAPESVNGRARRPVQAR